MKSRLAVGTLLLLSLSWVSLQGEEPEGGVRWQSDLIKARTAAVQSDRPMLLVFGAEWCTYCKKMEATTLTDPALVRDINEKFVPVHLDFDKQKRVAEVLKIKAIPCSVVLSAEAEILARHDGYAKVAPYRETLDKGLRAHQINLTSGKTRVSVE